jgi:AcrR family transcriptional regulator
MTQRGPGRPVDQAQVARKRLALLEATKAILVEQGIAGLTLEAVAERAGEYKGAVRYYFKNKDGLISALVEFLVPDLLLQQASLPADRRLAAVLEQWRDFWLQRDNAVAFVEILPLVVRDPSLRERMRLHYREYEPIDAEFLEFVGETDPARLKSLSVIVGAVIDGVAQQYLLDPDRVDIGQAFSLFVELMDAYASGHTARAASAG